MTAPAAPRIPHLVPGEVIGRGGFATVYLYREEHTDRDVAVKVLSAQLAGEEGIRQFRSEARLMARLSTHPHIVTIHNANVTESGLPYLVMEYCSGQDLGQRARQAPLPVAEALRVGIQVSGALESAHRAAVLHRDVKPANILTTDYGKPALTDFGISASSDAGGQAEGLSIPWSPPEALDDPGSTGVASDVWSMAATVWHLLVGHSPFAVNGGANDPASLVARIHRTPLARTGRPDVPAELERLLARAMEKRPTDRPGSVLEFARGLQTVERTAGFGETTLDVYEPERQRGGPVRPAPVDDEPGTRIRRLVVVDPERDTAAGPAGPPPDLEEAAGRTTLRPLGTTTAAAPAATGPVERRWGPGGAVPAVEDTALRPAAAAPEAPPQPAATARGRRGLVTVVVGGAVVAAAVAAVVLSSGGDTPSTPPDADPAGTSAGVSTGAPAVEAPVPTPEGLAGARAADGSVVFTWISPDPQDGDQWLVRRTDPGAEQAAQLVAAPEVSVTGVPDGAQACVEVSLRRADARTSNEPATACGG